MDFLAGSKSPIFFPSISSSFPISKKPISVLYSASFPKLKNSPLRTSHKTISSSVSVAKSELQQDGPQAIVEVVDDRSLSELLNSSEELTDALREIIYANLVGAADDEESLSLVRNLVSSCPSENEWKFLAAQLLSENGKFGEAKKYLEEVLESEPFSMDALYELAVVMNKLGEDKMVHERLQRAMDIAKSENKEKEVREISIIMAQMLLLQDKLEDSLKRYEELASEDSEDCRPHIAQGVIYTLMDKDKEAKEKFEKLKEIAGEDFYADDFLQNGLRKIRASRTDEDPEEMSLKKILELEFAEGPEF